MGKKALMSIMLLISFFAFAQSNNVNEGKTQKEGCHHILSNTYGLYTGEENNVYLFHLYPQLHEFYFFNRFICNEFLKRQKYITPDLLGTDVSYVLYRLNFFNNMIKVFSNGEFGFKWNGVMFYDYEKKRLLVICFDKYYPPEKKDLYLGNITSEHCISIEYFDLNKGIYEFATGYYLPSDGMVGTNLEIKENRLEIDREVPKGTFPGIDRDYCCKESIPITDEIRAFLKYTDQVYPEKSAFRKHLEKIDRETYKRFEKFAKSPEGKKYKVFMTSNQEMNIVFLKKVREEKEREKKEANAKEKKQQKNNNRTDSSVEK